MKYVYLFTEGDATMRNTLGGKGANLCQMTKIGLPVPQGFVVSTEACNDYQNNQAITPKLVEQIKKGLKAIEKLSGKKFGNPENPLILSVRSGARVSMPGMMDSILNLGLNDEIVQCWAVLSQNPKFAYDCYRRFIQMYADVVHKVDSALFEAEIDKLKKAKHIKKDQDFTASDMKSLIVSFKKIFKNATGKAFPQDVFAMLIECIEGVFKSWNNERAIVYRKINNIPSYWGTAVNVQQMVFGNLNDNSGTGVCFSRNPTNGENQFFGEFLLNAQGEDIVAGIRTPSPIKDLKKFNPRIYDELYAYAQKLETVFLDMQDMEFTIENNKLFVLQTRNGKRTTEASIKIAVDLVKAGLIDKETAIKRIEAGKITELLNSRLEVPDGVVPIAKGIPASPGGAVGKIALDSQTAEAFKERGEKSILVRFETSAEDISGMMVSEGILTARGGTTSHAAVVARGVGTVCVSGCDQLTISGKTIQIGCKLFHEGDYISLDGTTGEVFEGALETNSNFDNPDLTKLLSWAEKLQKIDVFANADTSKDASLALKFGAAGIGLCRTEHMFFDKTRVVDMQKLVLATDNSTRKLALKNLLAYQKADFEGIFATMGNCHVTIRLLDPPLHEFMPKTDEDLLQLAQNLEQKPTEVAKQIELLRETNPMMGHRGLRLAVSFPEIYEMQTKAIVESALKVQKKTQTHIVPEIMIPLTSDLNEFLFVKQIVEDTIKAVDKSGELEYKIGTMIETPRACLIASDLALHADFFSFGTNDLTQFMYGFSRDDAGKFLPNYYKNNIFTKDIFMHLDTEGVGKMMENVVRLAKRINPKILIGICGEHAGDPESIDFCKKIGLDYVSCSVMRIPVAKFASC